FGRLSRAGQTFPQVSHTFIERGRHSRSSSVSICWFVLARGTRPVEFNDVAELAGEYPANDRLSQCWQEITSGEAVSLVSWEARLRGPIDSSSAKLRSHWRAPPCRGPDLAKAYSATLPTLQSIIN